MARNDYCYCKGVRCAIKTFCARYVEGLRLPEGNWWWIEQCDEEDRNGYIKTKENDE